MRLVKSSDADPHAPVGLDPVTGLLDHWGFVEILEGMVHVSALADLGACLALFGFDGLAGHEAGRVAGVIADHVRSTDVLGALVDGTVAVLFEAGSITGAGAAVLRVREICQVALPGSRCVVGMTCTAERTVGAEELIARAGVALGRARRLGVGVDVWAQTPPDLGPQRRDHPASAGSEAWRAYSARRALRAR